MASQDHRTNLGGDIFMHGKAVTIGCIPVGDENIEELFFLIAKAGIDNTKFIIAPYDMRLKNNKRNNQITWLEEKYARIRHQLKNFKRI